MPQRTMGRRTPTPSRTEACPLTCSGSSCYAMQYDRPRFNPALSRSRLEQMSFGITKIIELQTTVATHLYLRVPICKGGLSGCQTGSFDSGKVQAVAEEFDKDYGFGGSCEKLRKGMAEGNGDDLFGGCQSWPNGSNPGAE